MHVSATPPAGYQRDENKRLVKVEPDATVIREVFQRRARGDSWPELTDFLTASGVKSSKGNTTWSVTGASSLI